MIVLETIGLVVLFGMGASAIAFVAWLAFPPPLPEDLDDEWGDGGGL